MKTNCVFHVTILLMLTSCSSLAGEPPTTVTAILSGQVDMRGMGYDGTVKAQLILVENRIYLVVMSVYHEDWCNCLHQMNQVVDSLYIDPSLSIPFEPTP